MCVRARTFIRATTVRVTLSFTLPFDILHLPAAFLSLSNTPYSWWVLRHRRFECLECVCVCVCRQPLERKHYLQVHWGAWFPWDLWMRNAFPAPLTSPGRCPGQTWCPPVEGRRRVRRHFSRPVCRDVDDWSLLAWVNLCVYWFVGWSVNNSICPPQCGKELSIVHVSKVIHGASFSLCLYIMPVVQALPPPFIFSVH